VLAACVAGIVPAGAHAAQFGINETLYAHADVDRMVGLYGRIGARGALRGIS
jgi:hypothetical protein